METSFYRDDQGWWALTTCALDSGHELRVLTQRDVRSGKLLTVAGICVLGSHVREPGRPVRNSDGVIAASYPRRITEDAVRRQHETALKSIDVEVLRAEFLHQKPGA